MLLRQYKANVRTLRTENTVKHSRERPEMPPFIHTDIKLRSVTTKLADDLRRIASEIESGDIQQVILTAIRRDGRVERIGEGLSQG